MKLIYSVIPRKFYFINFSRYKKVYFNTNGVLRIQVLDQNNERNLK